MQRALETRNEGMVFVVGVYISYRVYILVYWIDGGAANGETGTNGGWSQRKSVFCSVWELGYVCRAMLKIMVCMLEDKLYNGSFYCLGTPSRFLEGSDIVA